MPRKSLEERMDSLERRVEILERLPERVTALESQIVLLRDEMRSEFSATRERDDETGRVLRAGDEETRRVLTERMEFLFDANERHMRLLHEDLVQRIATINEGRS
jgi:hypothetical protein